MKVFLGFFVFKKVLLILGIYFNLVNIWMNFIMDEYLKMVDSVFIVMIIWCFKLLFLLKKVLFNYFFI